jgi:hypothetical protein
MPIKRWAIPFVEKHCLIVEQSLKHNYYFYKLSSILIDEDDKYAIGVLQISEDLKAKCNFSIR